MNTKQYYTAPSKEIFEDIKNAAIEIWNSYDDTFGYASGKIDRIKHLENIGDNTCHMVAMFDRSNQIKLLTLLEKQSSKEWLLELIQYSVLGNNQS